MKYYNLPSQINISNEKKDQMKELLGGALDDDGKPV